MPLVTNAVRSAVRGTVGSGDSLLSPSRQRLDAARLSKDLLKALAAARMASYAILGLGTPPEGQKSNSDLVRQSCNLVIEQTAKALSYAQQHSLPGSSLLSEATAVVMVAVQLLPPLVLASCATFEDTYEDLCEAAAVAGRMVAPEQPTKRKAEMPSTQERRSAFLASSTHACVHTSALGDALEAITSACNSVLLVRTDPSDGQQQRQLSSRLAMSLLQAMQCGRVLSLLCSIAQHMDKLKKGLQDQELQPDIRNSISALMVTKADSLAGRGLKCFASILVLVAVAMSGWGTSDSKGHAAAAACLCSGWFRDLLSTGLLRAAVCVTLGPSDSKDEAKEQEGMVELGCTLSIVLESLSRCGRGLLEHCLLVEGSSQAEAGNGAAAVLFTAEEKLQGASVAAVRMFSLLQFPPDDFVEIGVDSQRRQSKKQSLSLSNHMVRKLRDSSGQHRGSTTRIEALQKAVEGKAEAALAAAAGEEEGEEEDGVPTLKRWRSETHLRVNQCVEDLEAAARELGAAAGSCVQSWERACQPMGLSATRLPHRPVAGALAAAAAAELTAGGSGAAGNADVQAALQEYDRLRVEGADWGTLMQRVQGNDGFVFCCNLTCKGEGLREGWSSSSYSSSSDMKLCRSSACGARYCCQACCDEAVGKHGHECPSSSAHRAQGVGPKGRGPIPTESPSEATQKFLSNLAPSLLRLRDLDLDGLD